MLYRLACTVAVVMLSMVGTAVAQTCQVIGGTVFCQPSPTIPSAIGGGYTIQHYGGTTFYNYNNPQAARREGLPNSSMQLGNTKFYDNGVTRQSIGGIDFYSNGVTRQRIGNTDFYSNGKVCQQIGGTTYCN